MVSNFLQRLGYSGLTAARPAEWSWWDTFHLPAWRQTQQCFSRTDNIWIADKRKCFQGMWHTALHTGTVLLLSGFKPAWTFAAVLKMQQLWRHSKRWHTRLRTKMGSSSSPGHLEAGEKEETMGSWGLGTLPRAALQPGAGFPSPGLSPASFSSGNYRRTLHKTHPWMRLIFLIDTW